MLRSRPLPSLLLLALASIGCDEPATQPTVPEVRAMCEAQTTPEGCAAVPGQNYANSDESAWCAWMVEVPVTLEGDVCSFGEPTSGCQLVSAGDPGCYSPTNSTCGPTSEFQWSRTEDDSTFVLGYANEICSPPGTLCTVTPEGVLEGGPECACLCQPDFPTL